MVTATRPERPSVQPPQREEATPRAPSPARERRAGAPPAGRVPAGRSGPTGLTWDQFLAGQLGLALALALVFGFITLVVVTRVPAGARAAGGQAAAPAKAGAPGKSGSLAFTGDTVAQQVQVAADPNGSLKWDKAAYDVKAGDVSFVVTNHSPMAHNFAVEGNGVKAQSKDFGTHTTNTFTLKGLPAGDYQIVCNIPGHKEAGMVAKLVVK
jgi:uncharacterized cupredoxin-like copper-binding protein